MRFSFLLALLGVVACSSETNNNTDGSSDDAGQKMDAPRDRVAQETGPSACSMGMCEEAEKPSVGSPQCVMSVKTRVVDGMGGALGDQTIYVCGTNLCTPPQKSDAMGNLTLDICAWFEKPAYKYIGGGKYASFAAGIPSMLSITTGDVTLYKMPAMGVAFPQGGTGDVISGSGANAITLSLTSATVKFDPTEPMDADHTSFRAVEIPVAKPMPFFDNTALKLEVIFALEPVNAILTPPAKLTVPNVKNWAANAAVELFLNGANSAEANPPAPYGKFGPIGTGKVSSDGKTVVTDSGNGNGVPMLGMVGIRLKM